MCTLNTIIFCLKLNTINLIVVGVIVKTRVDGIWRSWSRWRLGWCVWGSVCVFWWLFAVIVKGGAVRSWIVCSCLLRVCEWEVNVSI